MKDITKNVEADKSQVKQNETNKVIAKPTVNKPQVAVNKNNTKSSGSSTYKELTSNSPKGTHETSTPDGDKTAKPISKKVGQTVKKITIEKSPQNEKNVGENIIQNKVGAVDNANSKEETQKANSGNMQKKKVIILKKNAKKVENKVNKLKKKVKKAIKKDVKIIKLKGLKEKFKEAIDKLKRSIKKLKKAKK